MNTTLISPDDQGFDPEFASVDKAQIAFLREIQREAGGRLILKGGMAMRAVVGSMRLTCDIDFDRDPKMAQMSTKGRLVSSLKAAATASGIKAVAAEITKDTLTTVRARLTGRTAGSNKELRFEVEVSGRQAQLKREYIHLVDVAPPGAYRMAPFAVASYNVHMLAAMKIAAAMSDTRNVPRDVYDLHLLIAAGADPVELLSGQESVRLEAVRSNVLEKLSLITFDMAKIELLPYLPASSREALDEDAWLSYTLEASEMIEQWVSAAIAAQKSALEDAEIPVDLHSIRPEP